LSLLLGGISASVAQTIVAPLDRIKILLQLQHTLADIEKKEYQSAIKVAQFVWREHGFLAFWRGNGTNVLRYFPTQALNFAFKERYTSLLMKHQPPQNFTTNQISLFTLIAGGLAGGTTEMFVYPLDFIRTKLVSDMSKKSQERKYKGIRHCFITTVKTEGGFISLYRGFWITVCGIIPYRAIYFGGYDFLKRKFLTINSSFFWIWIIAQINTTFAQLTIYPLDTVRRHMIVHGGGETQRYKGAMDCIYMIWKEEGLRGFYKGAVANFARATGGALCMAFYDTIKKYNNTNKK